MADRKRRRRKASRGSRAIGGPIGLSMARVTLMVAASLGLALALYLTLSRLPTFTGAITSSTASATGFLLRLLGADVSVKGSLLNAPSFSFAVVPDCTPLAPFMLLAGAMLAFPAPLRDKLLGLLVSGIFLSVLNLVRVMSLVYVGIYAPQWLEAVHLVVWQSAMVLAGILMFLWWMRRSVRAAPA